MPVYSHGLPLKKKYGQHFLRQPSIIHKITETVSLTPGTSVFEIGCGDGVLTKGILDYPIERLWVFEIDPDWAHYVREEIKDPRLTIIEKNILDLDFTMLALHAPWVLLANLPYQITFPILHLLKNNRHLLQDVVIMVQEEVAQKLLKTSGRGYGFVSLYFSHYFTISSVIKVPPSAFMPPPKVFSRVIHLKPIKDPAQIVQEGEFWKFIKACFQQPRRTLRNNLMQSSVDCAEISPDILNLRAQQMNFDQLLALWNAINH